MQNFLFLLFVFILSSAFFHILKPCIHKVLVTENAQSTVGLCFHMLDTFNVHIWEMTKAPFLGEFCYITDITPFNLALA